MVAQLGATGPDLAEIVTELRSRLPELGPAREVLGEYARFALFDSVAEFLRSTSSVEPLVVILDDLHDADPASLLLLRFLARSVSEMHLLVVALYRPVEAARPAEREQSFSALLERATALRLSGLAGEEVALFVEQLADEPAMSGTAAAIAERTDGNPLFIKEFVRLLMLRGRTPGAGNASELDIPDTVRDAIERRLALLAEESRRVLGVASVIGRDFAIDVIASVAAVPRASLEGILREAGAAGVLSKSRSDLGHAQFTHALFRETLYAGLDPQTRARIHGDVAAVLERAGDTDLPQLAKLSYHAFEALRGGFGEPDRAHSIALRAAGGAMENFAYEEAATHLERALRVRPREQETETTRAELLLRLGEALVGAGQLIKARDVFREAAHLARRSGAPEILARAALGWGGQRLGQSLYYKADRELIALLEESAAELESLPETSLSALVLARLAVELQRTPDAARARAVATRAAAAAERVGDPRARIAALYGRCFCAWGPDGTQERLDAADEIVRASARSGDLELECLGRQIRLRTHAELGDAHAMAQELARLSALAARLRTYVYEAPLLTRRAWGAFEAGRAAEAARLFGEVEAFARDLIPELARGTAAAMLLYRAQRGPLEESLAALRALATERPGFNSARGALAWLLAEGDLVAEARKELAALAADDFTGIPRDDGWLPTIRFLAFASAILEDEARARRLYGLLAPYASRYVTVGASVIRLGPVAAALGMLASTLGRWEEAERHFADALARASAAEDALARFFIHRERGAMFLARGAEGDRSRALEDLYAALELGRSVGVASVVPRAERLFDRAGGEAHTRTLATLHLEGDFWTVTFGKESARIRNLKGIRYVARLVAEPYRELHALELVRGTGHEAHEGAFARGVSLGALARADAILDRRAKAELRERAGELRAEAEEARSSGDEGRAVRAERELQAIARELRAAVGLGGRDRTMTTEADRARVSVRKAVWSAVERIAAACPRLGEHLRSALRTGWLSSYSPDPRERIEWRLGG